MDGFSAGRDADELTARETALAAYFKAVAGDPQVRGARSLGAFKDAILRCVAEDVPAVFRIAVGRKLAQAEPMARFAARSATGVALGGALPAKVGDHVAGVAEELVGAGVARLRDWLRPKRR